MTTDERIREKPSEVQQVILLLLIGGDAKTEEDALARWEELFKLHAELSGFDEGRLAELMLVSARTTPSSKWARLLARTN